MRFPLLALCILVFVCVSPLSAETLDADHADVKIEPLPAGWSGNVMNQGVFLAMNTVGDDFEMIQVNSSSHSANFKAFCDYYIPFTRDGVDFKEMKVTEPTPTKVGPTGTLEFDITGKSGDTPRHIHVYLMAVRKTYAVIKCWCDEADWEKTKAVFDEVAKNAK